MTALTPFASPVGEGRLYTLGKNDDVEVVFRADGDEAAKKYSITEWWMSPGAPGLDAHVHQDNDEVMFVLEGAATILMGEDWTIYEAGSVVIVPAGVTHGFRNDGDVKMGLLNIFTNGAYEAMMPAIKGIFAAK